jgi:hypothetical protein
MSFSSLQIARFYFTLIERRAAPDPNLTHGHYDAEFPQVVSTNRTPRGVRGPERMSRDPNSHECCAKGHDAEDVARLEFSDRQERTPLFESNRELGGSHFEEQAGNGCGAQPRVSRRYRGSSRRDANSLAGHQG